MLAIFLLKVTVRLYKTRRTSWRSIWNLVDAFIILMSISCVIVFALRMLAIQRFLDDVVRTRHNKFINYFSLLEQDDILTVFGALLVGVSTIRLWKMLRFATFFRVMEMTLLRSLPAIFCLTLCHLIVLLVFSFAGFLFFVDVSHEFRDTTESMMVMVLLSLSLHDTFDFDILDYSHSFIGHLYYIVFMFIMLLIYTLYIAVIMWSYVEAQIYFSTQEKTYYVMSFLRDEIRYNYELVKARIKEVLRIRSKHADQEMSFQQKEEYFIKRMATLTDSTPEKYVVPKEDVHRYANCISLPTNRMLAMHCIAKRCLIRNSNSNRYLTPELMLRTLYYYLFQDAGDKEMFFKGNFQGKPMTLIDDQRLVLMEEACELLLTGEKPPKKSEPVSSFAFNPYKEIIAKNLKHMEHIQKTLKSLLKIVKHIKMK